MREFYESTCMADVFHALSSNSNHARLSEENRILSKILELNIKALKQNIVLGYRIPRVPILMT